MDRDFLERARPIPHNERASDAVGASPARIVRIAFDGAHGGAVARLHDAHVVGDAVSVPVEEHDVPRRRRAASRQPAACGLEPLHARGAVGELGHRVCLVQ